MSRVILGIVLLVCVQFSPQSDAARASWTAQVTRILNDTALYGLCMASITPDAPTEGLACGASWVTFSCSGDFNSKQSGTLKYDTARLALVTGNDVFVQVNDSKLHNGYCFVERIDGLPAAP